VIDVILVGLRGSIMYDQDRDYSTRHSSSHRIAFGTVARTLISHRALDGAGPIHLYCYTHRPGRGRRTSLDTLCIDGDMGIFSLYAGKLSLWHVSPLSARVARQYQASACGHSGISFPFRNQRVRNCIS
jgi:hypothetical protein